MATWYPVQVSAVQYGTGGLGPEELERNRADAGADLRDHPTVDGFYEERTPELEKITVPVLSATNWAHHLHTRGGFEGYERVSSPLKWLEVHGLEHFAEFYTDYGVGLQKRFFGHFLKGEETGWDRQPPVQLNVRHADGSFELRDECEWPLARTEWTSLYLHTDKGALSPEHAAAGSEAEFTAHGPGLTFATEPMGGDTEVTGPASARLFISSTSQDADLFLTLRVLDPDGKDVTFVSGLDPAGVVGMGWLRASHRSLDPDRSRPYRPFHTHVDPEPLTPGEIVALDVEIWPTSFVVPAGHRVAVTIQGEDFAHQGAGPWPSVYGVPMRGHGIFLHNDPHDRPAPVYHGVTTVHSGPEFPSRLLLPLVPRSGADPTGVRRGPFPLTS